jgi:signal transduction histidine kinase
LTPIAPPPRRTRTQWAVDVAVAVLAAAAALPFLFHDNSHPSSLPASIGLLAVIAAPLVLRRIYPIPVLALMLVLSVAVAPWNNQVVAGFALLIALFTVVSSQPRKTGLIAAAVVELLALGGAIYVSGNDFWYPGIFLSGLIGAALGLGLYAGTRQAYLAALHDRAERLELERDQQGALTTAAERARITREMHDVVAHHLTVIVALTDGAIAATATSPERGIEAMRTVAATGRRALADTRRMLGVLRSSSGETGAQALQPVPDLAELDVLIEHVRAAGLPTSYEVHGSAPDLPAGIQLTVYRLVQEALTNTLKHAGSDARAGVWLRYLPGELQVDIVDDGDGDNARTPLGVGGGLTGMRERVQAYGGDVTAGPARPRGWRVSARLRLDAGEIW